MLEWMIWFYRNYLIPFFFLYDSVVQPRGFHLHFFFQLASTQQGFTLQVFVAPSLWCVLDCPFSHVCVRSKAVQLLWCLLCPPVWSFGAGSRKERDLVVWLRASPALWLQELLIHVQLCVKWIRDRVNQSAQEIYLLQVSEMCEEKV